MLLSIDQGKIDAELGKASTSYVVRPCNLEQPDLKVDPPTVQIQSTVSMLSPDAARARTRLLKLRERLFSNGAQPLTSDELDRHLDESD